jgi:DNA-binding transcriptional LysR family regulator
MARGPATATLRHMVRRVLLPILIALACTAPASAAERPAPPFSNADYWTFADDLMRHLDSWWDPAREGYILRGVPSVRVNSALLLAHAVAALVVSTPSGRPNRRAGSMPP